MTLDESLKPSSFHFLICKMSGSNTFPITVRIIVRIKWHSSIKPVGIELVTELVLNRYWLLFIFLESLYSSFFFFLSLCIVLRQQDMWKCFISPVHILALFEAQCKMGSQVPENAGRPLFSLCDMLLTNRYQENFEKRLSLKVRTEDKDPCHQMALTKNATGPPSLGLLTFGTTVAAIPIS